MKDNIPEEYDLEYIPDAMGWFEGADRVFPAYRDECLRTCPSGLRDDELLSMCALGVTGEAGEVADLIKKHLYQGHGLDRLHVIKELGDVLYYMAVLADAVGVDLWDVMVLNVDKLHRRYPDGFEVERSTNRAPGDV